MKRDAIDFENGQISSTFRKVLIPTLLGTLSMSAMTAIDGIIVGHGVGDKVHLAPDVPNFGVEHRGPVLHTGNVIAIEPMLNLGRSVLICS